MRIATATTVIMLCTCSASLAEEKPPQYTISTRVFQINPDAQSPVGVAIPNHTDQAKTTYHPFTSQDCQSCHQAPVAPRKIDGKRQIRADAISVHQFSAPKLTVFANQDAHIAIIREQPLSYFVREPDGRFRLVQTSGKDTEMGLKISVKITPTDENRVVLNPIRVETRALKDRKKIPGIDLPIGEPIIDSYEMDSTIAVELGKDFSLGSMLTPKQGWLLISARVDRAEQANPPREP